MPMVDQGLDLVGHFKEDPDENFLVNKVVFWKHFNVPVLGEQFLLNWYSNIYCAYSTIHMICQNEIQLAKFVFERFSCGKLFHSVFSD